MTDEITALHSRHTPLTKSIRLNPDGSFRRVSFGNVRLFDVGSIRVRHIYDIFGVLHAQQESTHSAIIRGALIGGVDPQGVRRLLHSRDGHPATFREVPRRYVMLDMDDVECPQGIDPAFDPEAAIEHLIGLLPERFREASCAWHVLLLAGVQGKRALGSPLVLAEPARGELGADRVLAGYPVDHSLFNPVQLHYTAPPVLEDGLEDPLPRRLGGRDGSVEAVEFPVVARRGPAYRSSGRSRGLCGAEGFEQWLARIGDDGDGFYQPINSAVASYIAQHDLDIDAEALKEALRTRILTAEPGHRSRDYIEDKASDQHLDAIIMWVLAREAERHPPPYFVAEPLSLPEAENRLREAVHQAMAEILDRRTDTDASDPPQVGIRAAAGLGKTRAVIEALAGHPEASMKNVEVYVPSHDLAEEWARNLREAAPHLSVLVIRGRGRETDEGPMCRKAELAQEVAQMGFSVQDTLCRSPDSSADRCHYFERCRYQAQFEDQRPAVRIMAHEYLVLPRRRRLPSPDLVVIDERFWGVAVKHASFGLDRLVAERPATQPHAEWGAELARMSAVARDALEQGLPLRRALREAGYGRDEIMHATRLETTGARHLELRPGLPEEAQRRLLHGHRGHTSRTLSRFWRLVLEEWGCPGDQVMRVELRRDVPRSGERQDRVFLHWRSELRVSGSPVLAIDADLDERIAGAFLPYLRTHDVGVERNAEVVQLRNRAASNRFLLRAERIADLQAILDAEAFEGRRALLAATKRVAQRIQAPDGCEVTWFGAIRGVDRWTDLDTVIVAGREQPPHHAVEGIARALFYDRDPPLSFIQRGEDGSSSMDAEVRGYRMRDGTHRGANVQVHPDADVQRVLEQHRERESAQAVDRIRSVRAASPKRVILLSSVVLDVTVDRLVRWNAAVPSRLERALMRHGAVPLSGRELHRCFPDLWPSPAAARQDLRRVRENCDMPLIGFLLRRCHTLTPCEYRRPNQRGRWTPAVVDARHHDLRAVLEAVVGEIASFRFVQRVQDAA